jgi:hypothetical protein
LIANRGGAGHSPQPEGSEAVELAQRGEQTVNHGIVIARRRNMSASEGNAARAFGLALGFLLTAILALNAFAF